MVRAVVTVRFPAPGRFGIGAGEVRSNALGLAFFCAFLVDGVREGASATIFLKAVSKFEPISTNHGVLVIF